MAAKAKTPAKKTYHRGAREERRDIIAHALHLLEINWHVGKDAKAALVNVITFERQRAKRTSQKKGGL